MSPIIYPGQMVRQKCSAFLWLHRTLQVIHGWKHLNRLGKLHLDYRIPCTLYMCYGLITPCRWYIVNLGYVWGLVQLLWITPLCCNLPNWGWRKRWYTDRKQYRHTDSPNSIDIHTSRNIDHTSNHVLFSWIIIQSSNGEINLIILIHILQQIISLLLSL